MSSADGLLVKQLLARGEFTQTRTDTPVGIRIKHDSLVAVTSVTITTGTNIVLIDADGTNTLAFATYTTIGAVADAINSLNNWSCIVLDALRADASTSVFVTGAITSGVTRTGVVVWDCLMDTSASLNLASCAHADRDFSLGAAFGQRRVKLLKADYAVNMGTAAAASAQLWSRIGSREVVIISDLSVDTTATTLWVTTYGNFIGGRCGEELILKVKDAATLADATGNYTNVHYTVE